MSEYIIREYESRDIPELTRLWTEVFDEDERMLKVFFESLGHIGSGLVAVMDGKIVGAGYALLGQEFVRDRAKIPLGLIYGIAVDPQYRRHGIGRNIVRAVAKLAAERGAGIICCEPANQSLVKWYDDVLSLKPAIFRQEISVAAGDYLPCRQVSAAEYAHLRELLLGDKDHVQLSARAMGFEEEMLRVYGGGFYFVGNGIAAAHLWEEQAIVRELICPGDEEKSSAASVAHALSAKTARLCKNADGGQAYILSDKILPPDCLWNLSFN